MEKTRESFVLEVHSGEKSKSALCREYGISRPTGDKWLTRWKAGEGLSDRSRAPFKTPNRTPEEVEAKVVSLRAEHPAWGPRKLKRVLENRDEPVVPAASTICGILQRNGLVSEEASLAAKPYVRFEKEHPNEMWQADFKGDFALLDGQRCHPLTVLDDHSRFSLCIHAKDNERLPGVKESFEGLFREYGLPDRLLCDNGNPWGTVQSTGFTRFEVWMMDLGVHVIHGRIRHPQTQGKEERFHRTLKREALYGQELKDLLHAQQVLDAFRHCYNHERPHEALGLDVPAQRYTHSTRPMPQSIEPPTYPAGYEMRRVRDSGYLNWRGQGYFLSEAFGGLELALKDTGHGAMVEIHYRDFCIAQLNADERAIVSKKIRRAEH